MPTKREEFQLQPPPVHDAADRPPSPPAVFDDAVTGMAVLAPDTRILRANAALCALLDQTQAELQRQTLSALAGVDGAAARAAQFAQLLSGEVRSAEWQLQLDGMPAAAVTCTVLPESSPWNGGPVRLLAQFQDIRERVELEQALVDSEKRFRGMVQLAADWYWEQDEEFRFTNFSGDAFNPVIRVAQTSAIGKRRWEMDEFTPMTGTWAEHEALVNTHLPYRDFVYIHTITGLPPRYYAINGDPVFDAQERFRGYRGTARDITERVEAQQEILRLNADLEERVRLRTAQLEAANKDLQFFSYSIAHDLRGPLSSMDGFGQMLEATAGAELSDRSRHFISRIRNGARQMGELTDGLLALAQLSRAEVRHVDVDLVTLAQAAVAVEREARPREVEVVMPASIPARGDPRLLGQVFGNLVGNAWKFTARQAAPRIEIGVLQPGDPRAHAEGRPVYFIRDNGAGFDMEYAARLFQPFQRMHTDAEFEGTGIGLSLVQKIVQRHCGRIWAEARPEEGATFYFTLGV